MAQQRYRKTSMIGKLEVVLRNIIITCLVFICALGQGLCSNNPPNSSVVVSGSIKKPIIIVCPKDNNLQEMGEYLRNFLAERGYAVKPGFARVTAKNYAGPQWVLATLNTYQQLGAGVALPKPAKNARDEAYILDVRARNHGSMVLLVGKSEPGLRSAVARLVSTVANDGQKLTMSARREVNDPFVRIRAIMMGASGRRQCPEGSPFKDIDFESWPIKKIMAYPDLFRQFGFNCVQIGENRGYGSIKGAILERTENAIVAMVKAAKNSHMLVSLDLWGDCPFNEGETYSWNDPAQHKVMVDYMEEMGRRYGSYIDHYNVHIGDPGGCTRDGCDPSYKTSQQITAEYLKIFRKYNPKVMGAMSTWANCAFWLHSPRPVSLANYGKYLFLIPNAKFGVPLPDGAKFLDETFMPKEIGIAQQRFYNDDQADMLVAAGRPVDIWAWYVADMEMINNLYIAMHQVDEAYGSMPDSARDKIRLSTAEITFHGWPQIINQYCAAQKMWNPRRDLMEIEREFCVGAFGPQNADAVLELYQVCENGVINSIPQPSDFGTADYNKKLVSVYEKSKSIKIPAGWKSNFAFPVPAQKLVDMLVARLRLTLAVSEAKEKVEAAKKEGAPAEQIARIKKDALDSLPKLPIDPIYDQSDAISNPGYKTQTFAEIIGAL